MRNRNRIVKIAMTNDEHDKLLQKIEIAGKKTIQSYGLDALLFGEITSNDLIVEIQNLNTQMCMLNKIDRGIANNLNQLAKHANTHGVIDVDSFGELINTFSEMTERRNQVWRLIRLSLTMLQHIQQ